VARAVERPAEDPQREQRERHRELERGGAGDRQQHDRDQDRELEDRAPAEEPQQRARGEGDERGGRHRAGHEVDRVGQHGEDVAAALEVDPAGDQRAPDDRVGGVERGEEQEALGHLALRAQVLHDGHHHRGRGQHREDRGGRRDDRTRAKEGEQGEDRAEGEPGLEHARRQQPRVAPQPAEVDALPELEQQQADGDLDQHAQLGEGRGGHDPGRLRAERGAHRDVAQDPRQAQPAPRRLARDDGGEQEHRHPEELAGDGRPVGEEEEVRSHHRRARTPDCAMDRAFATGSAAAPRPAALTRTRPGFEPRRSRPR